MRFRSDHAGQWRVLLCTLLGVLGACEEFGVPAGSEPHRELNFLDLADQPKGKAQRGDLRGGPDFMPPEGAIARDHDPYPYHGRPELAAERLHNPLDAADPAVVKRGELLYGRYCVPCHDARASGNGLVVQKGFPAPPSLMTQRVRDFTDGRVFHILTDGQNIMPSYASQIRERDRWTVAHYLRQLHTTQPVAPPAPALLPSPDGVDAGAPDGATGAGGSAGVSVDAGIGAAVPELVDGQADASLADLLGDSLGLAPGLMPPSRPRFGDGLRAAPPVGPMDGRARPGERGGSP